MRKYSIALIIFISQLAVAQGNLSDFLRQYNQPLPSPTKLPYILNIEWLQKSFPINIHAGYDSEKYDEKQVDLPDGFYFCGYKVITHSEHWSSYTVSKVSPKGFHFRAYVRGSTNVFNQESSWAELTIVYRAFRLTSQDSPPPNCDEDGWQTSPNYVNHALPRPSTSCVGKVLICSTTVRDENGVPSKQSSACGICTSNETP